MTQHQLVGPLAPQIQGDVKPNAVGANVVQRGSTMRDANGFT